MKIKEMSIPLLNRLAHDYVNHSEQTRSFFDYPIDREESFHKRAKELKGRSFPRHEVSEHLFLYNKKLGASEKSLMKAKLLADERTLVVAVGQQAGLLTGPLYTVHKTISAIQLATKLEHELGVPVVPVFWIAGEDHDLDEINHIYTLNKARIVQKNVFDDGRKKEKLCASHLIPDQKHLKKWIEDIVASYGETAFTNELLSELYDLAEGEQSYTDFFAAFMLRLFGNYGLVMLDSADPELRQVESPFFSKLISKNEELRIAVKDQVQCIEEAGYDNLLGAAIESSHLFYLHNDERVLLEPRKTTYFCGKQNECMLSEGELIRIAEASPSLLSNNVVSRPLMQEFLLPVLAFIAGPGEIGYWAGLRQAFHQFDFKMPPIIPRLSMTIVDRNIERYLLELGLPLQDVLGSGTEAYKKQWLQQQWDYHYEEDIEGIKVEIDRVHKRLRAVAERIDPTLKDAAAKNARFIQGNLSDMQKRIDRALELKYQRRLQKYDNVDLALLPLGQPQERLWNIVYYINRYGFDFVETLVNQRYEWNNLHKVVYV